MWDFFVSELYGIRWKQKREEKSKSKREEEEEEEEEEEKLWEILLNKKSEDLIRCRSKDFVQTESSVISNRQNIIEGKKWKLENGRNREWGNILWRTKIKFNKKRER